LQRRFRDILSDVFVVLHNVHAVSKVIETAQVVYGLGFNNFVVSKAEGSAAQTGVPEANRLAVKMKRSFMVMPNLSDVLEVLNVEHPLMITSPKLVKEHIDLHNFGNQKGERLVIVLSGSNSSFSRKEMDIGDCKSLDSQIDIGPAGTAAVLLYALKKSE
jgi:SpoU rRNA methylase family enzyme